MSSDRLKLIDFENTHHQDIFEFAVSKLTPPSGTVSALLDFSSDRSVFSEILAGKFLGQVTVTTINIDGKSIDDDSFPKHIVQKCLSLKADNLGQLSNLGKFDAIILKDFLHNVQEFLPEFLRALTSLLRNPSFGAIFIISRPKNPPLPVPDVAMKQWREMAISREQLTEASETAGLKQNFYTISYPIKILKEDWASLLKMRCLPAVKNCEKCTDDAIRQFLQSKSSQYLQFEEKLFCIILHSL